MMKALYRHVLVAVSAALAALPGSATGAEAAPGVVIENVTVIDVAAVTPAAARLADRTVVVRGDRIVSIAPSASAVVPRDARRIDGRGRFLLPALWDAHVHLPDPADQLEGTLLLFMANGVTSVRDMGNMITEANFARIRREIGDGTRTGPRIVATPMRITDGGNTLRADPTVLQYTPRPFFIDTARDGRAIVRYAAAHRLDFIKPYDSISREAFFAMMEEARRLGIPVGGHVPMAVTIAEAAEAGMRTLDHARPLPFNCTVAGDELRRTYDLGTSGGGPPPDGRALQNDGRFVRRLVDEYDERRCDAVLAAMKRYDMYYVPTHVTRRMDAFARQLEFRETPLLRYMHPSIREEWAGDLDFYARMPLDVRTTLLDFYHHGLMLTRRAIAAGVKVLAGTDAMDTYIVPGFSLHQELYEMAGAGIAPLDVLRTATVLPAEFFGQQRERGLIAPGYKADLLLLTADPLADMANTRSIDAVVHDGAVLDRRRLDAMLDRAAALAVPAVEGVKGK